VCSSDLHGRIAAIGTDAAFAVSGVVAIWTAEDIADLFLHAPAVGIGHRADLVADVVFEVAYDELGHAINASTQIDLMQA